MSYVHTPVLLGEALGYLSPSPGQNFIDATLGGGGYSKALLKAVGPTGKVLSIDLDQAAIENFKTNVEKQFQANSVLHHGNFRDIDKIVEKHKFAPPNGVVADIGFSSFQLDQSGRGLSFQKDEPLDMRFDQSEENEDAKFILNNRSINELEKLFRELGEEKFSRQIAKRIVEARTQKPLTKSYELYELIKTALPKPVRHKADDNARRIFQALRIEVNHELENLERFLPKAFDLLAPQGRLVVVSFHSLEDRIVKEYFNSLSKGCVCPPEFPICLCGKNPQAKILTKKPVSASAAELQDNSRAKPAKLRAIEKL
jgi:16S rRNA (cytosine1402-N4)-methyltransferase